MREIKRFRDNAAYLLCHGVGADSCDCSRCLIACEKLPRRTSTRVRSFGSNARSRLLLIASYSSIQMVRMKELSGLCRILRPSGGGPGSDRFRFLSPSMTTSARHPRQQNQPPPELGRIAIYTTRGVPVV